MLDDIFGGNEAPNHDVYESIQKTIKSYRDRMNKKIEYVAQELGVSVKYLRHQIDPNQPDRPLSIDRIIDIMNLTGDFSTLAVIADKFNMMAIPRVTAELKARDINKLLDDANVEASDVFREGKRDLDDIERITKELNESDAANARLRASLENIKNKRKGE